MDLPLASNITDPEQDQQQPNVGSSNNYNVLAVEKEHMFDKVVTPSDVGKLNRLVIPKQHAERYFPLDSSSNQNGMLLNFEDRNGKAWRFRYSYWNSSQSYVITKGWSRFVKEKKLDAGDIVSFQRGTGELGRDRLYIDWRHRPSDIISNPISAVQQIGNNINFNFNIPRSVHYGRIYNSYPPGTMPFFRNYEHSNICSLNFGIQSYNNNYHHQTHIHQHQHHMQHQEQEIIGYGYGMRSLDRNYAVGSAPLVIDSVPVVPGRIPLAAELAPVATAAAGKRLRLFGVNMECGDSCAKDEHSNSDSMPRGKMGASSSSPLQPSDDDQYAKKGKSSLSFDLDP